MIAKQRGRFRIQAVSAMTGVPAATLRAWERRYGVPAPARTVSSYRLYSEQDVELVRRLRDLCARGIAPAEAAKLITSSDMPSVSAAPMDRPEPFVGYRQRMLQAIERYDAQSLEAEARSTLMLGSGAQILEHVVVPLMHEVGTRWHAGSLSIAQEHLATEVLGNLSRDLLRLAQPAAALRTALLACFPGETHVLPLYVVGHHFAQWGFRVVLLGARTPVAEVARMVQEISPGVVALSWTLPLTTGALEEHLEGYAAACEGLPWVVGGQAAAEHAEAIARHGAIVAPEGIAGLQGELSRRLVPADGVRRRARG